jgi:signal transduction histidine kinase/response regulator RpfG family c-di-GMP phosphodiesterase/NAD-dependent dihydropyrimidine dehydrogenase PreA subunit
MSEIVASNGDRCVGCGRCVRECPAEMANMIYNGSSGIKSAVDSTRCVICGACIRACKHGARYYSDDTDVFFDDLSKGVSISLIVSPFMAANFTNWKQILVWLKSEGVNKIFDATLGADISIWANLRYIEETNPNFLISSICPAIVSYCETHRGAWLDKLSPVRNPIDCTAVYMKMNHGVEGKIAALSPCIAAAKSSKKAGLIQYNVTPAMLIKYMERRRITPKKEGSGFGGGSSASGSVFTTPGWFGENVEFFTDKPVRIDKLYGSDAYRKLDGRVICEETPWLRILDVMSCGTGCDGCSGGRRDENALLPEAAANPRWTAGLEPRAEHYKKLHLHYDKSLTLSHFMREYSPSAVELKDASEEEIVSAFNLLGKDTDKKRNFDCGACGCDSCGEMAKKIALKLDIPDNCIEKVRQEKAAENIKNTELFVRSVKYLELIHNIGEYMLASEEGGHYGTIELSIKDICDTLNAKGLFLWRDTSDKNSRSHFRRLAGWSEQAIPDTEMVGWERLNNWIEALGNGMFVAKNKNEMARAEKQFFSPESIVSIVALPIFVKGHFWGFTTIFDSTDRIFPIEELSVVSASVMLIVSRIMENEMTEKLILAHEEALAGTKAKSDFLSRMSHELRTPMNAIIGMTKIADNSSDIRKIQYCLNTIRISSSHMLGLINDVLDMAKIAAGKFDLIDAPFDMEKMLVKICDINMDKIAQKGLRLSVIIGDKMGIRYIGDEFRLSQVISNLVSNAVKFTPIDGRIVLSMDEVGERTGRRVLRFSVSDTGIGMTPDQIERIFYAFERADNSMTSYSDGTGLGLAISKNIVEMMNGRMWVESKFGSGSAFIFELELERGDARESASAPDILKSDIKVLIVDDDVQSQKSFKSITARAGARAECAESADGALALVSAACSGGQPYDVVFIKYDMPDINGLDLSKKLGGMINMDSIAIIVSFFEWSKIEERANGLGISRFLTSPPFPTAILEMIKDIACASSPESGSQQEPAEPAFDFSDLTLLLVEDIEINREIFVALLEDTGVDIDIAVNGVEAVRKFSENPGKYDLIVMDIQMPEMNGYDATKTIRSLDDEHARSIPIIAMTANALADDIDKCLASGMNAHVSKPIDEKLIMGKIYEYAGKDAGRRAHNLGKG